MTKKWNNPFDVPDVDNPDGHDVRRFAATVNYLNGSNIDLIGRDVDQNAEQWAAKLSDDRSSSIDGSSSSIDGDWLGRWNFNGGNWVPPFRVEIRSIKNRVFIRYDDHQKGRFLAEFSREQDLLLGRIENIDSRIDSNPCVIRIVSAERLDGTWGGKGRLDFRRQIDKCSKEYVWHDGRTQLDVKAELLAVLDDHVGVIHAVKISPSADMIATAGDDGTVRIYNDLGRLLFSYIGHQGPITGLSWSPTSSEIVSVSQDKAIKVWNLTTNEQYELGTHADHVTSVSWIQTGQFIATGSLDKTVSIWDATSRTLFRSINLKKIITDIMWRPNAYNLLIGCNDDTIYVLNRPDQPNAMSIQRNVEKGTSSVSWSADGAIIATSGSGRAVQIYDSRDGRKQRFISAITEGSLASVNVGCMSLFANHYYGRMIAVKCGQATSLWDIKNKKMIAHLRCPIGGPLYEGAGGLDVHPNGDILAVRDDQSNRILLLPLRRLIATPLPTAALASPEADAKDQYLSDIFLCHASEDKKDIIEPLFDRLEKDGVSCWYDNREIAVGDSLSDKTNDGIEKSKYVLAVISINFIGKRYANKELNDALDIESINGNTKVLALIVDKNNNKEAILTKYPHIAEKYYLTWSSGLDAIVKNIKNRIKK